MLKIENLSVHYGDKTAVSNLSFKVEPGQSLGIIGESGSGKTSLGMALMRLLPKKNLSIEAKVLFREQDILEYTPEELKNAREKIQMVFQDPYSSFNPRMKVGQSIEEGLIIHKKGNSTQRKEKVLKTLNQVGLNPEAYYKYPHEFSGGQRQRLSIARALVLEPEIIIADEPVSALDVSVQAQILNLMLELKKELGLTYIFIAHDLGTVDYFCDRVLVMYQGELMEYGSKGILKKPRHPYTKLLLKSLPGKEGADSRFPEVEEKSLCPFFARCPERRGECSIYDGSSREISHEHYTTCVRN